MIKKKSLGQHFLNSPKIIVDIVSAGKVVRSDVVIEVGPGEGNLTSALLHTGAHVVAIEKDDRLIPVLKEKFKTEISSRQLILVHGDVLEMDVSKIVFDIGKKYKVVANIPYYITGQVIRLFLATPSQKGSVARHTESGFRETDGQPKSMTLLVQKEVAERIVAKNGKESLLSLSVKIYGEPRLVRTVGRGAFSPQPNVDSAVLCIENISKKKLGAVDEKKFFKIIHAGFAHKRKQLLPNLFSVYMKEILADIFDKIGLDKKCRAEDLKLETWLKLCSIITQ